MEAPAGLVEIEYEQKGNKVDWVKFTNVKSYLAAENLTVECPELGELTLDVAYGGNFYAIVDPQKNFTGVQDFSASKIIQYSQIVRQRINEKYPNQFIHPENETIRDVTHMLWTGTPIDSTSSGRNAVFYGDKAIDRSACGKLGHENDRPVVGDWDGDGKDDIGIFGPAWAGDPRAIAEEPGLPDHMNRPQGKQKNVPPQPQDAAIGARSMKLTSLGKLRADLIDHVFHYGTATDTPIVGDWNGDGVTTIGVFREGGWRLDVDGDGKWSDRDLAADFGEPGDKPVIGDWNGDGIDDLAVYRGGEWIFDSNGDRRIDAADRRLSLGGPDDQPIAGDFNGDGIDEPALYHDGNAGATAGDAKSAAAAAE
jgi:hypothetical protein